MVTVEGTNNFLYSIKFEDRKEENWSEAEMMKYTEEARIPVKVIGYKFLFDFRSVTFSGEVTEILDDQMGNYQICDS